MRSPILIGAAAALALGIAAELAHGHTLAATRAQQAAGLTGRLAHHQANLRHARSAMRWCQRHRARFNGEAGTRCYWPHYRLARQAQRRLERVRSQIQASVFARLWAKWRPIAACETGGTYDWQWGAPGHPQDGFQGIVNFHPGTWDAYRGSFPSEAYWASPLEQLIVAERVLAAQGWGAWPECSSRAGYR